jgi:small subunit ribosomal protein S14
MAKKSKIAREQKLQRLAEEYADERNRLRAAGDWVGLSYLPRNSNPIRQRNRCVMTGRARGYMRRFGLSRITFREMALMGQIPGVTKSSW